MPRLDLKCRGEAELEAKILADPELRRALDEADSSREPRVRRELLARAVRLQPGMAPTLDRALERCRTALGVESALETYVYPETGFNAACVKPENGRVFVMISSGLFEAFEPDELTFVLGHELGHHLFDHHRIPVGALLQGHDETGPRALLLFAWSRYAEISADRAGLVCAGDLEAASRALFKCASGLRDARQVAIRPDDFLAQIGDMREELRAHERALAAERGTPRAEWFATHPFSPLRIAAAAVFARSAAFRAGGASSDELERETAGLMTLMEPGYLEEQSEAAEYMRRLLFAGGVAVATAAGGMGAEEQQVLEGFFGRGRFERVNPEALHGHARAAAHRRARACAAAAPTPGAPRPLPRGHGRRPRGRAGAGVPLRRWPQRSSWTRASSIARSARPYCSTEVSPGVKGRGGQGRESALPSFAAGAARVGSAHTRWDNGAPGRQPAMATRAAMIPAHNARLIGMPKSSPRRSPRPPRTTRGSSRRVRWISCSRRASISTSPPGISR